MRFVLLIAPAILLAGCASTATQGHTATPSPTATARFTHPPKMTINVNHRYTAALSTSDGTFTITLLPKVAPIAVNNFVFLARHHFYDGDIFHRIVKGFVLQTGDPTGTGFGGPGYTFQSERVTMKYAPGVVAMANTGAPNSNGSQFFVVTGPQGSSLNRTPLYTIFGKLTQGMAVVHKLEDTPVTVNPGTGEQSQPLTNVYLNRVVIHESD